jgi:site-specific DNA-methyltransferase (adenine-specific)
MIDLDGIQLHHGDCREVLASLPDCSVDSVVTDPPYELGFMGKAWDGSGIAYSVEMWAEVLRVLKPGGHLCAFGGTRTYHRMACAIEDAGFEIRDSLHWVYGSGFPKSLDVSKAIDKTNGEPDRLLKFTLWFRTAGLTAKEVTRMLQTAGVISENGTMAGHYFAKSRDGQPAIPTAALWQVIRPHIAEVPDWVDELVARIEAEREVVGSKTSGIANKDEGPRHTIGASKAVQVDITTAATDAAKQWEGWGTALKPAHEPIVLARRPLISTVAANVLTHGTGALNIDGARVGTESRPVMVRTATLVAASSMSGTSTGATGSGEVTTLGRWPANVIFDTEAGALLDEQADGASRFFTAIEWEPEIDAPFRYIAKPGKRERTCEGTVSGSHPTVKALALMRWLVRLVTPPGGTVLEPFAGSGTTLMACVMEGFNGIGIEMTDEYLPIIEGRVRWAQHQPQTLDL